MKLYMLAFLSAAIVASNFVVQAEDKTVKTVKTRTVAKKSYTQDDVVDLLNDAASQVFIGGVYVSATNPDNQYQVLTVALDNNSLDQLVVYQDLFGAFGIWVCSLSDWSDLVNGADVEDVYDVEYVVDENDVVDTNSDDVCSDDTCVDNSTSDDTTSYDSDVVVVDVSTDTDATDSSNVGTTANDDSATESVAQQEADVVAEALVAIENVVEQAEEAVAEIVAEAIAEVVYLESLCASCLESVTSKDVNE